MTWNDAQKAWLVSQGHIAAAVLEQAILGIPAHSDSDLCEILVEKGMLTAEQAHYVRHQVNAEQSQPMSPNSEVVERVSSSEEATTTSAVIPGYQILHKIGHGGMGVVYKGIQEATGAEVVMKTLLKDRMSWEGAVRFEREAQVLAQFSHGNIVPIREFGKHQESPFIVMGFIPGRDLGQVMRASFKSEPLSLSWILAKFKSLAKALAVCHEKGIVHRDLKPSNIMIEEETERPVIIDFGLAAVTEGLDGQSLAELTKTGAMIGTPAFMAPEQFDNKSAEKISDKADVWGLGATLFFCLTGQPPFVGDTPFAIYKKIIDEQAPLPSTFNKDLPPWIDTLCQEMLSRQAEQRPSMAQVSAALENSQWSAKKPITICVVTLAILAVVLVGLWIYSTNEDGTRPTTPEWTPEEHILHSKDLNDQTNVFTREAELSLTFRSQDENPGQLVALNTVTKEKARGQLQNGNSYRISFTLKTGRNQFIVKAIDRFKNVSKAKVISSVRDVQAPKIIDWSLPEKIGLKSLAGPLQFKVSGTLNEDGCKVFFGSKEARVKGRTFSLNITLKESQPTLNLTIQDRVRNSTVVPIPVCIVSIKEGTIHTHKTIRSALRKAPEARRIFVRPGKYRDSLRLSKSIDIFATESPPAVIIAPSRGSAIEIDPLAQSSRIHLRGIQLKLPDSSKDYLLKVVTGSLTLQNCILRSGRGGIGQCLGVAKKKATWPTLTLNGCTIQRRGPQGVVAEYSKVFIKDCQFFDEQESTISQAPETTKNLNSVQSHGAFLQIGREAKLAVDKSVSHPVKDRHIFVVHGTVTLRDSKFERAVREAFIFGVNSRIELLRVRSSANNGECVVARRCQSLLIEQCEFKNGGSGNIMNVGQNKKLSAPNPAPAIKLEEVLKTVVRDSKIMNYKGGAIVMQGKKGMTLLLDNCQFTNSSRTGIRVYDSNVTMTNCIVSQSKGNGVLVCSARASITGGQISKHEEFGVRSVRGSITKLSDVRMNGNLRGNTYKDNSSTIQK
ncbi:MAG: protein kinase [Planctomycetota bacterium]|nr:protein kinase [Planctomycetota bacterium]